jgi:hypothetical protein
LPHPVVLIEADGADGAEVLAYQVGEVLLRAGVFASVEVFARNMDLGDYHRAALAEAHRVDLSGERPTPDVTGATPAVGRPVPTGPGLGGPVGGPRPDASGTDPRMVRRRPDPPRPGPLASIDDSRDGRPPALRPVDRVIAARSAGPRRPRPENADRADAGFDEIASGLTFDRPLAPSGDGLLPGEGADGSAPSGENGAVEPPAGERRVEPPAGERGLEPPVSERRVGPPGSASGPERRPRPRPAPAPGPHPAGPDGARPPGGGSGKRPPGRPDDRPSDAPLSEVEQRLLRQLHEELAAREDESSAGPGNSRMFRGNGGARKQRPHRPDEPPPAG